MLFGRLRRQHLGSKRHVRKDYLSTHAETVKSFLVALQKGKAAAAADPDGALKVLMRRGPIPMRKASAAKLRPCRNNEHTAASEGKAYGWIAKEDAI